MIEPKIRFDDGAAYEQMGIWSRRAGEVFLDSLGPPLGLRWIDIGCGNRLLVSQKLFSVSVEH